MAYCPDITWNWLAILGSILIRSSYFSSEIIILQHRKKVESAEVQKSVMSDLKHAKNLPHMDLLFQW